MSDTRLFTDNKRTGYIMSKLYNFLNRENVILHMALWGLVSGALLGAGYMLLSILLPVLSVLLSDAYGTSPNYIIPDWYPLMPVFGMLFGGVAGMLMGIANGILMGLFKQSRNLTLLQKKRTGYCINVAVTLVAMWFVTILINAISWFFVGAPSIIALAASLLATERHFNLLLTRSDARKPKAKRDTMTVQADPTSRMS
jgi:hypothetical protein